MSNWEDNVRKVVPYTPGDQPKSTKKIKLNTNENPYPPAPGVKEALKHFETDNLLPCQRVNQISPIMRVVANAVYQAGFDINVGAYAVKVEIILIVFFVAHAQACVHNVHAIIGGVV